MLDYFALELWVRLELKSSDDKELNHIPPCVSRDRHTLQFTYKKTDNFERQQCCVLSETKTLLIANELNYEDKLAGLRMLITCIRAAKL